MSVPLTEFSNNDIAAHRISGYISPHRFSVRPYNRFSPEFTDWWFFTPHSSDSWPAFRFSKLFIQTFRPVLGTDAFMYAGFYIEKGYDARLSTMAGVKRTHIMQSDWYWHEFLDLARSVAYDPPMREVLRRSRVPLWISVDIQEFNKPPELDTERPPFYDIVQFTTNFEDLTLKLERPGRKGLMQLNTCDSLEDIAERIHGMEDLRFFWVNLLVGIMLRYGGKGRGVWGAAEVWGNALRPWDSWV